MKLSEPNILKVRLHKVFLGKKIARPLRVMTTGDWHISPIVSEKQLENLKEALAQANPDAIILQGDLVDSPIELRRETSLKKLLKELRLCVATAPTVLVLGGHDFTTPTRPAKVMAKEALLLWKKICRRCGVKLLLNEWYEAVPGLKIFGAFQDANCILRKNRHGELVHWDMPDRFADYLKKNAEVIGAGFESDARLRDDDSAIYWFAAHAPLINREVADQLQSFDMASFGHTHGGVIPLGMDEAFDRLHLHFGLISPNMTPLPRRTRGVMPLGDSTMMVVNPGMVAVHFASPKLLQNFNFLKAAEVSVVEIAEMEDGQIKLPRKKSKDENSNGSDLNEYF